MPEEEKRKYRNMSANKRGDVERLDCRGIPLAEIQQEQEKKKRKIEEMKSYIANNVSMLHSGNGEILRYDLRFCVYSCTL